MIGVRGNTDKDAHVRASCLGKALFQAVPGVSGVLDGRPNRFQEQTLLGIDRFGFLRRNFEEMRVELVVVLQETAPFTIDFSIRSGRRIRMIELLPVPALWRYQIN